MVDIYSVTKTNFWFQKDVYDSGPLGFGAAKCGPNQRAIGREPRRHWPAGFKRRLRRSGRCSDSDDTEEQKGREGNTWGAENLHNFETAAFVADFGRKEIDICIGYPGGKFFLF